jgi:quercetin dioxygenase-like cupin family protein
LHQEGYDSFCWYDVPGASYPKHRHGHDECLWILKGEISFVLNESEGEKEYKLKAGDRIYLPARTPHTAKVPAQSSVTYLVGEKKGKKP